MDPMDTGQGRDHHTLPKGEEEGEGRNEKGRGGMRRRGGEEEEGKRITFNHSFIHLSCLSVPFKP
jgi:hypothetical protein